MSASIHTTTKPHQLPVFLRQSKADIHAKFVDLEWQQRDRLLQGTKQPLKPTEPQSKWSRLQGDSIAIRNRYLNVEPFAENRIKLNVPDGANNYINASPIQLGKRKYIATQGPKDTSVNHFYRMVAAEVKSPVVVVMLTQTHEAGREKCFQYYPLSANESPLVIGEDTEVDDGFHGEVVLDEVVEDPTTRSEVRRLRLRTTQSSMQPKHEEKEIRHLLFSGWPDFLIPEGDDREALVELIRLSNTLNRTSSNNTSTNTIAPSAASDFASTDQDNPRIIHCSAGVGRSGTFIALDYLLSLMYAGELDSVPDDKDLVADTVDLLRQQRMMMVQGESQFHFVYDVLREKMTARLAEMGMNGNGDSDAQGGAAAPKA
ncbi:tyrosine protein phosphatase 1 [Recurvomyces mirabilis]|nr:tyrosine protein phosphatase 1 [Recurvomyces mirabilis]